jgi:hypothetical protein
MSFCRSNSETNRIEHVEHHSDQSFHTYEIMLRDHARVTAYYDAFMSNKHLFDNKV